MALQRYRLTDISSNTYMSVFPFKAYWEMLNSLSLSRWNSRFIGISSRGIWNPPRRKRKILRKFHFIPPNFHFILPNFYLPVPWRIFICYRAIGKFLPRRRIFQAQCVSFRNTLWLASRCAATFRRLTRLIGVRHSSGPLVRASYSYTLSSF